MSFEMLFTGTGAFGYDVGKGYLAWLDMAQNSLVFHMSPERGGGVSVIPVPAAFWLFGTALIGFVSFSKRTKISA